MKIFLILSACVAIVLMAMPASNAKTNYSNTKKYLQLTDTSIKGSWQLRPVLASDTASGTLATITFNLSDHKFTGNTGCNTMSGHFVIVGDSLSFNEQIILTKMACPGYNEKAFINNLTRITHYKIENGVLQLLTDKTVLSEWVRKGNDKDAVRKV